MNLFQEIPDLTPEQFRKFADLVYREAFIHLKENKVTLLSNRLRKRLRDLQIDNFDTYYQLLQKDSSSEEMIRFIEVVTTNETYFWRTTQNFEMLKENILPLLLERFPGQKLLFWSAGCSTGEEPYNLAIEIIESMKKLGAFDFQIVASDISQRVVDFAREGVYNGRKIERVPPLILQRYFRPEPDREGYFRVREDIRERVEFRVENIFNSGPTPRHMVFCRNVMIYFSREDQQILANHFHSHLKEGGFLVIGHSESLHMMETPFRSRHFEFGVSYEKLKGGA